MALNILSATHCDCVLIEFKNMSECEVKEINRDAFKFSQTDHLVENFYFKQINKTPYKELPFIIKIVMALIHDQVSVECGVNINNFVLKTNITPNVICHFQKDDQRPLYCKQPKTSYP